MVCASHSNAFSKKLSQLKRGEFYGYLQRYLESDGAKPLTSGPGGEDNSHAVSTASKFLPPITAEKFN